MIKFTSVVLLISLINIPAQVKLKMLRAVGGNVATKEQFTFFARLRILLKTSNKGNFLRPCGASLISEQWLVTAARCFNLTKYSPTRNYTGVKVYMGTNLTFGTLASINFINKVYAHPDFLFKMPSKGPFEIKNDIALVHLKNKYKLSKYVQPISLPQPNRRFSEWVKNCQPGIVIGAGDVKPPRLYGHYVMYSEEHPMVEAGDDKKFFVLERWIKGHTTVGDTGGPFICRHNGTEVLYGITTKTADTPFTVGNLQIGPKAYTTGIKLALSYYERVDQHLNFILSKVPNVKIYQGRRKG